MKNKGKSDHLFTNIYIGISGGWQHYRNHATFPILASLNKFSNIFMLTTDRKKNLLAKVEPDHMNSTAPLHKEKKLFGLVGLHTHMDDQLTKT